MAVLPGKLTDCESRDIAWQRNVPGRGRLGRGSAKMGRDKSPGHPAVARQGAQHLGGGPRSAVQEHPVHDIAVAIGVDPHGPNDTPDLSGLRYGKVCILSDADVDGSHIQVLLLTLFFRHFPKLIEAGHVRGPPAAVPRGRTGPWQEARHQGHAGRRRAARHFGQMRKGRRGARSARSAASRAWADERRAAVGHHPEPDTAALMPVHLGSIDFGATENLMTKLMGRASRVAS